ncbi:hypothetical protein Q31b_49390 [Novipirellula aureliae]|uniref:Uncharacterized protein n=1 Tax=Novipirellula aureliae TaxID=2527966 RepID=A0A5C6DLH1_9BACT|nr:hypothetical protein Q31b_49390 [Novipirellula aureliae]
MTTTAAVPRQDRRTADFSCRPLPARLYTGATICVRRVDRFAAVQGPTSRLLSVRSPSARREGNLGIERPLGASLAL